MSKIENTPAEQIKQEYKEQLLKLFISKNEISEKKKEEIKPVDEAFKKWNTNDRITNLFANKIEKDTELKVTYAKILIGILIFQLFVLNVLFILKGRGILDFSDTTFNIFITGGIAEIFVLVRTIVKYLFKDDLTELLKIILKANNYKFKEDKNNKEKN